MSFDGRRFPTSVGTVIINPAERSKPMGIWNRLTRPKAVGMFINDGVLYAQRYTTHEQYRLLRTSEEQLEYLKPQPIPLPGARVFFDAIPVGQRTAGVAFEVGPFIPVVPVSLGKKKIFSIKVYTSNNTIYQAWSPNGRQAIRLYRKIGKQITAANRTPAIH